MSRLLRALPLLFLALAAVPSPAAEVGGLYEALVPVSGQSAAERSRAVGEGLRQVLVKVAGQRSVLALPAIQPELRKGDSLLGSFRYEAPAQRPAGQAVDPLLSGLRLRLEFDPAGVRAVLNRAGAPIWSDSRPPVHVWVVRGETAGTLLALGTVQADTLIDAVGERGLPAVLPSPGDTQPPAGARIALLATLAPAGGRPHINGVLRIDGVGETLEVVAADEFTALRELVAQAADRLGARYAVAPRADQARLLRLRVTGIAGLEAYAGLERWLSGLPLVKEATLETLSAEGATLLLLLAGEPSRLVQAMGADGRFAEIGTPIADGTLQTLDARLAAAP
ncbi:MAG: DUF2066 domain-containing protein [Pseudomonadota bacterium]